ncbi:MAG: hypothetical protein JJU29_12225 [Verrucomicrobia bacterium]|nr:hypothetical protein [Verrucomicrobiota bacterium]MCH8513127.1 hypothetical protein [Kiritimatiellia bacterium]
MGLKAFLLAIFLVAGVGSQWIAFDDDEFQHTHMAWLMARGEVPHLDFFEHHLPLYHLLLAPFTLGNPGPDRILWLRGLSVLIFGLTLWAMDTLIRRRTGQKVPAVILFVAASPIFFLKMIEVRPEGFCILLAFLAMLGLGGKDRKVFWAGFLAGAMVMGSQKFIFLAAGIFVIAWMEHGFRGAVRFALGGAISPVLIFLYFLVTGALPLAWEHLVVLNAQWKETFSPAMYAGMLWETSAILLVTAGAGLLAWQKPPAARAALVLVAFGTLAVFLVPIPFRQTFLMLYPGLVLASALGWQHLETLVPRGRPRTFAGAALLIAALLPAFDGLRHEFSETLHEDMALMRHIHEETEGPFFDGRGLVYWRSHVGYYPWLHEGLMMMLDEETYSQTTQNAIREAGFPLLLWDYRIDYMPESLRTFFTQHYLSVEPSPLMVPGARVDRARLAGSGHSLTLPGPGVWQVTWQGGEVFVNDTPLQSGAQIETGADPIRVRGRGFVRDLRFIRVEARP